MNSPGGTTSFPVSAASIATDYRVEAGACHVHFAYDIGFAIDLEQAQRHISDTTHREFIRRTKKAPRYFEYRPAPLSVSIAAPSIRIAGHDTESVIELVLYDFGAISVLYRLPLSGSLESLKQLALALYDNEALLADSRLRVQQFSRAIAPSISKPYFADLVEDYVVFSVARSSPPVDPKQFLRDCALPLAQLLRAETQPLSAQEVEDSLSQYISFGTSDVTVIDWNAAFLLGEDMDDVLAVLEFANVELLEMRFLDDKLDHSLTDAYRRFSDRRTSGAWRLRSRAVVLNSIARLQLDGAILFEGVNNTLKLMGDPYLARVYRLASQRFHLSEWDASILRKLGTLDSIYSKISDQQSAWRMEVLEWIIILLIAISIVISFK